MQSLLQDIRFAFRTLTLSPGLALAALGCAALGIGLCTAIFSVVCSMLLRPLGFADPDKIGAIVGINHHTGGDQEAISFLDYSDLQRQSSSFSELAGYAEISLTFSGPGDAELVQGAAVSSNLFSMLGVQPVLGRSFTAAEDRPGGPGAVLLSHALWVRSFRADPAVVGQWTRVDDVPHLIVGVMPARFQFPVKQQAWVAMTPRLSRHTRSEREVEVVGRLKPHVVWRRAQAETATIAERLAAQYPEVHAGWQLRVMPLRELFVSRGMQVMSLTMMGAATFILLIACANVANLLLAWAASRQREIGLRAAFGASPARIVRQLLTESMLLAAGGGLAGALVALAAIRGIESLFPPAAQVPYWMVFSLDLPVLGFTAAAAVAAGLVFGLVPALQDARMDLVSILNEGGRAASAGRGSSRLRSALVVAEVGLSVMLLIGGALFVRSFFALQNAKTGFDERQLLTLRSYLPGEAYADDGSKVRWLRATLQRIESLPGVEAAYGSSLIPLAGGGSVCTIKIAGKPFPQGQEPRISWAGVTAGFFRTLNVPIELGRSLSDTEGWENPPVAVVNQALAERFFAKGQAIGQRLQLQDAEHPRWLTIVGVVRDFKTGGLDRPAYPGAYLSYPFLPSRQNGIVIRARGNPAQLTAAVRREIRGLDPGIPVFEVATMSAVRRASVWQYRLVSKVFSTFGGLALLLAAIGIYGVLSYSVSRRWREIGTRIALGAQPRAVISLIVRQGMPLAAT